MDNLRYTATMRLLCDYSPDQWHDLRSVHDDINDAMRLILDLHERLQYGLSMISAEVYDHEKNERHVLEMVPRQFVWKKEKVE